jgi:hypothetical protein
MEDPLFIGFEPSKVVQNFATIHSMYPVGKKSETLTRLAMAAGTSAIPDFLGQKYRDYSPVTSCHGKTSIHFDDYLTSFD